VAVAPQAESPRRKVGPFAALLIAHAQMTWNRTRRGLGRRGLFAVGLVVLLLVLACSVFYLVFGFLGYLCGHGIDKPLAPLLLGAMLGGVSCVAGFMGGVLGGTRQLTWEAYRGYPLPFRTLFFAELAAGLGDVLAIAFMGQLACMGAGFASQRPALVPMLMVVLVQCIIWMLCIQQLVGALALVVVRRLRYAAFGLAMAAWAGVALVGNAAGRVQGAIREDSVEKLHAIGRAIQPLLEVFPPVLAVRAMSAVRSGQPLRALALELPMIAVTLALGGAAYAVLRQEARQVSAASGGLSRSFAFRHPALGVAELHLHHILSSMQGRFGLVIPLVTLILIRGPFASTVAGSKWITPGAVTYLAVAAGQLQFNQFGLDGKGVKTLLLLPISMRDILLGKASALAAYCAMQYGLLFFLMGLLMHIHTNHLVGGVLMGACLIGVQTAEGHFVSVVFPRPLSFSRLQPGGLEGANLIPLGLGLLNGTVCGGTYSMLLAFAPRALVPGMLLLLLFTLLAYAVSLKRAERFVTARRETLVQILG
jgi:hypothetical protein